MNEDHSPRDSTQVGLRNCSKEVGEKVSIYVILVKGATEDEMVGWHHQLDGHESEQALGVGDGQGSLACCSAWGCRESDTPEQLN